MNHRLTPFVNALLDPEPSPFCDYILSKELLCENAEAVRGAYEWAKRFKLYTDLQEEQQPDGSWFGLCDAVTAFTKGKRFKSTAKAMRRMSDLSLDADDPMAAKALNLCRAYLTDERLPLELERKRHPHPIQIELAKRAAAQLMALFVPDDPLLGAFREKAAAHFRRCCTADAFDFSAWRTTDADPMIADFSYESSVDLLSLPGTISEEEQRLLLAHEWARTHFGGVTPPQPLPPDDPHFIFYLYMLERLQRFSLFGEQCAPQVTPFLLELCGRLADPSEDVPITVNRYFGPLGQYSEARLTKADRQRDLLLRIVRILNHCI